MEIELASASDKIAICKLGIAVVRSGDGIYPPQRVKESEESCWAWINERDCLKAGLVRGESGLIGYGRIEVMDRRAIDICGAGEWVEIARLMVHPQHRRAGVARSIIAWALKEKPERSRLGLVVMRDNVVARRVYEDIGFSYIGEFPGREARGVNLVMALGS